MRLIIDRPSWYWRAANTDYRYVRHELPQLATWRPDINFEFLGALPSVRRNTVEVGMALKRRAMPLASHPRWSHRSRAPYAGADLIWSNDAFPHRATAPVIWMNTLLAPDMRLARGDRLEAIERETTVKAPLFRRAAMTLVSSEAERTRILHHFPDLHDRILSSPYLRPSIRAVSESDLLRHDDPTEVRFLFVGNDARLKRLPAVISALDDLPASLRRRVHLTVVSKFRDGEVPPPQRVEADIFRGADHESVMAHFREAHVLVNPSRFESYGFVFIEAMATGAVPIGPAWEVQREIMDDGRAGVLIDQSDESLRHAIRELAEGHVVRATKAHAGRDRFLSNYSADVVALRLGAIIDRTIELGEPT